MSSPNGTNRDNISVVRGVSRRNILVDTKRVTFFDLKRVVVESKWKVSITVMINIKVKRF